MADNTNVHRHIQFLRSGSLFSYKQLAIDALKRTTDPEDNTPSPLLTAKDGEAILARYAACSYSYTNSKWVRTDFSSEAAYTEGENDILLTTTPVTVGKTDTGVGWDTTKRYVLFRTVMGICHIIGADTRNVTIVEDTETIQEYIHGLVENLDYTDSTTNNWITTSVSQTDGLISVEKTELKTDGSIEYTYTTGGDPSHTIRTSSVVISDGERILGKIDINGATAASTNNGKTVNDVDFLSTGDPLAPLSTKTVQTGKIYKVGTDPNYTYYRWNGNSYVTVDADEAGSLFTGISVVKLTDEEISHIDNPNIKEAYRVVDASGNQIGELLPVYKDSSLYKVYSGKTTDTLQNMYAFKNGSTVYYTTNFALDTDHSNLTYYSAGLNDTYTEEGTNASFTAETNTLTISGTPYMFNGYATPWITKDATPLSDATIKPGKTPSDVDWLNEVTQTSGTADPTIYHITTSGTYAGTYYTWNGTTYEVVSNPPKAAICYVYQYADDSYALIPLSIDEFISNYIFGRGLSYNATTKVLEVKPGYGIDFDATGAVTLSTNVLGGITYYAKSTNVSTDYTLSAAITNTNAQYQLLDGATVIVNFANDCTATSNLTLNVNATGDKPIVYKNQRFDSSMIEAGDTIEFVYDAADATITGDSPITGGVYRFVGKYGGGGTSGLEYITNTNNHDYGNYTTSGRGIELVNSYTDATINTNAATYSATWLTGITQTSTIDDTKYRITSTGNFYGRTYTWNGSRYVITNGVTQDVTVKVAKTMVDNTGTHIADVDNLITITTNGLTMRDTWDCMTY